MLTPWKKSYDQPRQHIKKQRHYFANKGLSSQGYGFSPCYSQSPPPHGEGMAAMATPPSECGQHALD